ncbi:mechanosensitive ion channel domain-containing protein, partial [Rhodobaculum claviforme]|uniref:mechanosensitive ion channel domain-containing protein n=1 Tax=Rhodobaculum claviforme TaxID=1549854 RepID=UPI001912982E
MGDISRLGDTMGTVEAIGLRSTRLRTLDRTLIPVPNSQVLDLQPENSARRDRMRFATTLQLRHETTPDRLRCVLAGLRRLPIAPRMVLPDPVRVRLAGLGAQSPDIEALACITAADVDTFAAAREDGLLRILALVDEAGAPVAFPSMVQSRAEDTAPDP